MDKKAEKDASNLANFILNNMSVAEALHILAKKSQEVAEEMIKNNINHSEYKNNLLKDKETKTPISLFNKISLWFNNVTNKKDTKENDSEKTLNENTEATPKDIPKQTSKKTIPTRTGFSTKKKKSK